MRSEMRSACSIFQKTLLKFAKSISIRPIFMNGTGVGLFMRQEFLGILHLLGITQEKTVHII